MTTFTVPIRTYNLTNSREHWAIKAKRAKAERKAVMYRCPKYGGPALIVVTIVRVGPRVQDGDGLQASLKGIRDGIASRLGVDDGSAIVRWEYGQETGEEYEVRVRIDLVVPG